MCTTLWGQPSGPILEGNIGRLEIIFFLPIMGQGHEKDFKNPKEMDRSRSKEETQKVKKILRGFNFVFKKFLAVNAKLIAYGYPLFMQYLGHHK